LEKTLTIDGKQVKFKSTGGTARRYRNQFGADLFADIMKLQSLTKLQAQGLSTDDIDAETLNAIDFSVFENIAWTLAKTADPEIPDPDTWFDSFDVFPVMDIYPELQELIQESLQTKKK